MTLFWFTLLLLHQRYALVPVTTVQLGDNVTLKCSFPEEKTSSSSELHWYKQSAGNALELILKLMENTRPTYGPEFLGSRLTATYTEKIGNLMIRKTTEGDEGMYHCAVIDWNKNIWQGTYLIVLCIGNTVVSSNYTVVQTPTISKPVHPGDPVTLQCSVLSSSDSKKCSGDLNLFWIRAGDKSLPNYIYTDGNRENKCEEKLDSQQRCVYNFSKTVNASDATFYCAVATCGEIYFGNGTNIDIKAQQNDTGLYYCIKVESLKLIFVNGFLLKIEESDLATRDAHCLVYSAPAFTKTNVGKAERRKIKATHEETIYTHVRN
uniref:Ig-like domain-containing protein n=1 Tax=Xiphophorus couchianus TaxID=32473 RepID=A0A3B5KU25_9TELE